MVSVQKWDKESNEMVYQGTERFEDVVRFLKNISPEIVEVIIFNRWTENHVKVVLSTKFDFHYHFTTRQLDKIYDFLTRVNGEKIEER